ncbi:hypothetical protein EDB86DRAFT_2930263 [Lactarius hatsudake]|nr:hypothetical protein EDB86DRAFT_2930263 [Lactarius hatsudake]
MNERSVGRWLALETQCLIIAAAAAYIASVSPLPFVLFINLFLCAYWRAMIWASEVIFVLGMLDTLLYGITAWRW